MSVSHIIAIETLHNVVCYLLDFFVSTNNYAKSVYAFVLYQCHGSTEAESVLVVFEVFLVLGYYNLISTGLH